MKFKSKSFVVEANQYLKKGECPLGLRTNEDGSAYVITIQGQAVSVQLGDWVIIEPGSNGANAYPCTKEVFEQKYEPFDLG